MFEFETTYRGQTIQLTATMQCDSSGKRYADCDHHINGEFRGGHGRDTMVSACKIALQFAKARVDLMLDTPTQTLLVFNQSIAQELKARVS